MVTNTTRNKTQQEGLRDGHPRSDVLTKALNGAEMGRMVPRVCGYLNETRQLLVQPIGQHKVTSDAVGWYGPSFLSEARQVDTYAVGVI